MKILSPARTCGTQAESGMELEFTYYFNWWLAWVLGLIAKNYVKLAITFPVLLSRSLLCLRPMFQTCSEKWAAIFGSENPLNREPSGNKTWYLCVGSPPLVISEGIDTFRLWPYFILINVYLSILLMWLSVIDFLISGFRWILYILTNFLDRECLLHFPSIWDVLSQLYPREC